MVRDARSSGLPMSLQALSRTEHLAVLPSIPPRDCFLALLEKFPSKFGAASFAFQDPRMKKLVKKFRLDKMAESKLCEAMSKWDEDKQYRPALRQCSLIDGV